MTTSEIGVGLGLVALVLALVAIASNEQPGWLEAMARSRAFQSLQGARRRMDLFAPLRGALETIGRQSRRGGSALAWPGRGASAGTEPSPSAAQTGKPVRMQTLAVYEAGVFKPETPLDLPDRSRVRMTIELGPGGVGLVAPGGGAEGSPLVQSFPASGLAGVATAVQRLSSWRRWLATVAVAEGTVFAVALAIYAVTRLWALDQFPIYFFADEAVHANLAQDLLGRGFHDAAGNFLPLYFEAAGQRWTPLLSVYVHVLPLAMFGKSIVVARGTSAVVSLLGAASVGLILKLVFRARLWWAGVLFTAIAPAWFLHSRTAFETVIMASFLGIALLFYLLYLTRSPRYLYPALLFGAAAFYTYSNGQVIVGALGLLLLVSDWRYHLRQWRTLVPASVLGLALAWPLISFRLFHPVAMETHLRVLNSYWFESISLGEKLQRFAQIYWTGLSPGYWFFSNTQDLVRHRFDSVGHLPLWMLPFMLIGLGVCFWRVRSGPHRAVVLALLATPAAASLVGVGITRVLAYVLPACVLAGLGLDFLLARLRNPSLRGAAAPAVFAALSLGSLLLLRQALVEGPLWFRDYGLYGMQYGAKQLFEEAIPDVLARDPKVTVLVSPTWANGTDTFLRFFYSKPQQSRITMLNVDHYLSAKGELSPNLLLVMTPDEYKRAQASGKFKTIDVDRAIPYPDGNPGFYLARLSYVDNVDALFAADLAERSRPVEGQIDLQGATVKVLYSRLGAGQPRDMFDGDRFTLVRGLEANPYVIELYYPQPHAFTGLAGDFGSMDFSLTVKLYESEGVEPAVFTQEFRGLPPDPHVDLDFGGTSHVAQKVRVEVRNLRAGDKAAIHIRDLAFH